MMWGTIVMLYLSGPTFAAGQQSNWMISDSAVTSILPTRSWPLSLFLTVAGVWRPQGCGWRSVRVERKGPDGWQVRLCVRPLGIARVLQYSTSHDPKGHTRLAAKSLVGRAKAVVKDNFACTKILFRLYLIVLWKHWAFFIDQEDCQHSLFIRFRRSLLSLAKES